MKLMIAFVIFGSIFGIVTSLVDSCPAPKKIIPEQPKFTAVECYYCGIGSKYIDQIVQEFPEFYDNHQNFRNYLNAVASQTCDENAISDARHCDITTSYVALYVYANWVASTSSSTEEARTIINWANTFMHPFCENSVETDLLCQVLNGLSLSLSSCKERAESSIICPATLTPCEVCSHYFQCTEKSYC